MIRSACHIGLIALALLAALRAKADDLESLARPQPGVLLLRGGQVLQGEITRAGDNYLLTLPTGEISVRAADVVFQCRDLDEAYAHRRGEINPARVDERVRLIEWCLQYGLFSAAAREIAEAEEQWPRDARVAALGRRLLLRDQASKPNPNASDTSREPSFEELDQLVRGLPPRAASIFTSSIQPLLLNQCATAACHGAQRSNEFALQRSNITRTPSRRLTLRNLGYTLAQIDRKAPDASPLLLQPAGRSDAPHETVFTDPTSAAYKQLVAWVRLVAGEKAPEVAASGRPADSALMQFAPPVQSPATGAAGSREPAPNSTNTGAEAPTFAINRRGGLVRAHGTFDPLDPEVFNRRHFPDRQVDKQPELWPNAEADADLETPLAAPE